MKIAIITPVFPPYHAGIGRVAEQEAEGLAKLRHEVTILTPLYKKSDLEFDERLKDYQIRRLKPVLKFGNAAWLPSLTEKLAGFDVIHLHYPFIGGVGSLLKYKIHGEKYKIPLVVTYHMDLVGYGWKGLFFNLYSRLTLPRVVRIANKIIVSSLDYARHGQLAEFLEKEPSKFVEVPFGVKVPAAEDRLQVTRLTARQAGYRLWETKITELRQKLGIKDEVKVILFVGGLDKAHYFKGVDILLEAFKDLVSNIQYPIFKLLIVGEGDLRSRYEKQARELGLASRVIFAGRVESEDLPVYYQAADVFVLPSLDRSEAYGLVLLEAMAQGVPVVASDLPGVRTLVGPDRGLLVRPDDAPDLSRALAEILPDEEKRKKMGEMAREWVAAERPLEREINKLDRIFNFLLE